MRDLLNLFLAAILLACPALCRGAEDPCCRGDGARECSEAPGHPAPGPVDEDSCICSGAVLKAEDGQAGPAIPAFATPAPDAAWAAPGPSPALRSRGRRAASPGGRTCPVRLHVLLEVHRC